MYIIGILKLMKLVGIHQLRNEIHHKINKIKIKK